MNQRLMNLELSSKAQKRKQKLCHKAYTLKLNRHVLIWGTESLQNVSTQLVLFWINEQPPIFKSKKTTPMRRFAKLCHSKSPDFENLATALGKDSVQFADDLDQMVQKGNKTIYFPSWDVLKIKVRRVKKLLADCSRLEIENPFESFLVKNISIFWKHYNPALKIPAHKVAV